MDRRRRCAARLSGALILAALLLTAANDRTKLAAERWLAADGRLEALASRPSECAANTLSDAQRLVGRTAFRTPALLGGQAARAGLTCESCHAAGHDNPAFHVPELSDAPGTADVTSSLMSSHRGNGLFDPRRIPDLTKAGKVSRKADDPALQAFIRGLIVEEFDGAEPPPAALRALTDYVRAMRPCASAERVPVTLDNAIADVEQAVTAARLMFAAGDRPTARLMLAGARTMLGLIDERFPGDASLQQALRQSDRGLRAVQDGIEGGDASAARRLASWRFDPALRRRLERAAPRSLYDRATLARLLAG